MTMNRSLATKRLFKHSLLISLILIIQMQVASQVNITNAIDFNVKDVDSESHHLFEYLNDNKIVVLDFFTATCGPCQTYATQISDAYDYFGCNSGNVIFLGINWGSDNDEVRLFDSLWDARYPGVSGIQGGGNAVVENYQVISYPTVCVITPDHLIFDNYIWPPAYDSIVNTVLLAGGIPQQCTVNTNTDFLGSEAEVKQVSPGKLHITIPDNHKGQRILNIYTINGQLAFRKVISSSNIYDMAPLLKKGFYVVSLHKEQQQTGRCKLIIL